MQAGTYFLCFENTEIMFSKRQCSKRIGHVSMFSQGDTFQKYSDDSTCSLRGCFPRDTNFQTTKVETAWSLTSNVEKTQFFKDPFIKIKTLLQR